MSDINLPLTMREAEQLLHVLRASELSDHYIETHARIGSAQRQRQIRAQRLIRSMIHTLDFMLVEKRGNGEG